MIENPHNTQLMSIGLSDKEARVYLATLELGPSSVQEIAKKSMVKRATTYVAIESLIDRGLISSFQKGKKRFFSATDPEQLLSVLSEQKKQIEEREGVVKSIMKDLQALAVFSCHIPRVSYYEGWDGINSLREDILRSNVGVVRELVSLDDAKKVTKKYQNDDDIKEVLKKKKIFKTLYTSIEGRVLPQKNGEHEARFISKDLFPTLCEVVIYGRKAAFLNYSGKPSGILVEDEKVAATLVSMFDYLWFRAK
jgi:sugar-specific transcriptional regulator TrmB